MPFRSNIIPTFNSIKTLAKFIHIDSSSLKL